MGCLERQRSKEVGGRPHHHWLWKRGLERKLSLDRERQKVALTHLVARNDKLLIDLRWLSWQDVFKENANAIDLKRNKSDDVADDKACDYKVGDPTASWTRSIFISSPPLSSSSLLTITIIIIVSKSSTSICISVLGWVDIHLSAKSLRSKRPAILFPLV